MISWLWNTPAEPVKPDIQANLASLGAMYSLCQKNTSVTVTKVMSDKEEDWKRRFRGSEIKWLQNWQKHDIYLKFGDE